VVARTGIAIAGTAVAAAVVAACGGPSSTAATAAATRDAVPAGKVDIALYPGTAIVHEERRVPLSKGRARVRFDDMPRTLDPGSVRFRSLSDPDGTRAVDQTVQQEPSDAGDTPSWAVLTGDPNQPVRMTNTPSLEEHAPAVEGVAWTVESATGGEQTVAVSYQTRGLSWSADYAIVLRDGDGTRADMNAWITVDNQSGRTFEDATVSLAAQKKLPPPIPKAAEEKPAVGAYGSYVQPPTYLPPAPLAPEYRLYTYPRGVTLRDRAQRQLEWFEAPLRNVPSKKPIVFDPVGYDYDRDDVVPIKEAAYAATMTGRVSVSVELPNVSRALPPGRVRVFERAADGRLNLLGAGALEHVDAGDPLRVQLGEVPGIAGTRKRTDFRVDKTTRRVIEAFEIELENTTDAAKTVMVREHLYRGTRWVIPTSSVPFAEEAGQAVTFEVTVKPGKKKKLVYRVVYSWDKKLKKSKKTDASNAAAK
jgi:hypothetical protein